MKAVPYQIEALVLPNGFRLDLLFNSQICNNPIAGHPRNEQNTSSLLFRVLKVRSLSQGIASQLGT